MSKIAWWGMRFQFVKKNWFEVFLAMGFAIFSRSVLVVIDFEDRATSVFIWRIRSRLASVMLSYLGGLSIDGTSAIRWANGSANWTSLRFAGIRWQLFMPALILICSELRDDPQARKMRHTLHPGWAKVLWPRWPGSTSLSTKPGNAGCISQSPYPKFLALAGVGSLTETVSQIFNAAVVL